MGGFLVRLQRALPDIKPVGLDLSMRALTYARDKSSVPVVAGSVNDPPFRDRVFIGIAAADVMYHCWADPGSMACEAFRCLEERGIFVVNVPAYNWLRGPHDERVYTQRRYTRSGLTNVLREAGFSIVYSTYLERAFVSSDGTLAQGF